MIEQSTCCQLCWCWVYKIRCKGMKLIFFAIDWLNVEFSLGKCDASRLDNKEAPDPQSNLILRIVLSWTYTILMPRIISIEKQRNFMVNYFIGAHRIAINWIDLWSIEMGVEFPLDHRLSGSQSFSLQLCHKSGYERENCTQRIVYFDSNECHCRWKNLIRKIFEKKSLWFIILKKRVLIFSCVACSMNRAVVQTIPKTVRWMRMMSWCRFLHSPFTTTDVRNLFKFILRDPAKMYTFSAAHFSI